MRLNSTKAIKSVTMADIGIIGQACRLPGANSVEQFWTMLDEGRCAVSQIPDTRWPLPVFSSPTMGDRGTSYTWSAGVITDAFGFDPSVFGISMREAEQMDPQQRLLLELTWTALEDAGIAPNALAGSDTGVFVGASALDYGNLRSHDPASMDAYTATGNALSILSNRISHVFDLHGPSFTVDTACSSSLVALNLAVSALKSGEISTAIIGGVNLLLSPASFVSFSQARMLSRGGRCRAFDADADGYVRAEGGVVMVLKRAADAMAEQRVLRGMIAGSALNQDGRTLGIAFPAEAAQARLLTSVYEKLGIRPDDLLFVEAHGTGTQAGDPNEAGSIGKVLGKSRQRVLPIGSVKTNVGHLEAASGLVGVLKATLALERQVLPRSLHFVNPNPNIDFSALNLAVCAQNLPLGDTAGRYAGINSFGFGGTNAHVIVAGLPKANTAKPVLPAQNDGGQLFAISAQTRTALSALAGAMADTIAARPETSMQDLAACVAHHRERMTERFVVPSRDRDVVSRSLRLLAQNASPADGVIASAVGTRVPVCFVYSGNGAQWVGMGRSALSQNPAFAAAFRGVDAMFIAQAGWSLEEMLLSEKLETELSMTSVSQPLIFALQAATTQTLRDSGLHPHFVIGHSVGEIAAALASGALSLMQAVRVIHARSRHQETTRGTGSMAVVFADTQTAQALAADTGGLVVAAVNSSRASTLAGSQAALDRLRDLAATRAIRTRQLDLAYPFHGPLMDPIKEPLLVDLADLRPAEAEISFISTVSGASMPGTALDGSYWWQNIRQPVLFEAAIESAVASGARLFLEIGAQASLAPHIGATLKDQSVPSHVLVVHTRTGEPVDEIKAAVAKSFAHGADVATDTMFGADQGYTVRLPTYPWERKPFHVAETAESRAPAAGAWHPLLGARRNIAGVEWSAVIDTARIAFLSDHKVGAEIVMPGAALLEIALAAARQYLAADAPALQDFQIGEPMGFQDQQSREVVTRLDPATAVLEILSRPRLAAQGWQTHATCKIFPFAGQTPPASGRERGTPDQRLDGPRLYALANQIGLHFGPAFKQVDWAERWGNTKIHARLTRAEAGTGGKTTSGKDTNPYGLHPARLDSCFHGLLLPLNERIKDGQGYIPVRFDEMLLYRPGVEPHDAQITIRHYTDRSILADFVLLDAEGAAIAAIRGGRFAAVSLSGNDFAALQPLIVALEPAAGGMTGETGVALSVRNALDHLESQLGSESAGGDARKRDEARSFLLDGWSLSCAFQLVHRLIGDSRVDPQRFLANGPVPAAAAPWFMTMLHALESAGLATRAGAHLQLTIDSPPPMPEVIFRTLASEHPEAAAELMAMVPIMQLGERLARGETEVLASFQSALFEHIYEPTLLGGSGSAERFCETVEAMLHHAPARRSLTVLQIGFTPSSAQIQQLCEAQGASLTIFEPNTRRAERARLSLYAHHGVQISEKLEDLRKGYDIVFSFHRLHRELTANLSSANLGRLLAPGGLLVALEPDQSLFMDMVFGLTPGWFEDGVSPEFPLSPLRSPADWRATLENAPFAQIETKTLAENGGAVLIVAKAPLAADFLDAPSVSVEICSSHLHDGVSPLLARQLAAQLVEHGLLATMSGGDHVASPLSTVLLLTESPHIGRVNADASGTEQLVRKCLALRDAVNQLESHQGRIYVMTRGAFGTNDTPADPVEAGFWAFLRTIANEYQTLDLRRIDVPANMAPAALATRLALALADTAGETEIIIGEEGTRVARVGAQPVVPGVATAEAVHLRRRMLMPGERIAWMQTARRAPSPGEVEVAVVATGLNFRDVMFALSLLPEDILEDGFAGPTLGIEFSGRVLRVGRDVTSLKPGDAAMGFAPSSFSSHLTLPEAVVTRVPDGVAPEAAATIPVAFLTSYYGLLTCANLQPGETVLIHAAAGGVGLAAIQIAKWRGAIVIATAGTESKRKLVQSLGADFAFDSRSMSFVEDVRRIRPKGVDVILNSLAGVAMEQSLSILAPFGRFIELGKRDYVANTHLGLRPFRRNLTYFGVDLDQLISRDPGIGARLMGEIAALFDKGELTALPFRLFQSEDVNEAFRLMQQSGHIGKLVVRAPALTSAVVEDRATFRADPARSYLVTGAFGGFGRALCEWLVERGARHLVLLGRSGAASAQAMAQVAALQAAGATVLPLACDVSDTKALTIAFNKAGERLPPIAGIFHAAMALEDGVAARLDAAQMERVLTPKVAGAENLHRLSLSLPIDHFVLFSSATTFLGNPGQASYVAANGFLEGLAARRHAEGRPALAVAWGAIADTGVLARNRATQNALATKMGVMAISARDALNALGRLMAIPRGATVNPTVAIAPIQWSLASERLRTLRSPTYRRLLANVDHHVVNASDIIDLESIAAQMEPAALKALVSDAVAEEVARVLRMPRDEISSVQPIADIGVDSLMAIELSLSLQQRFGLPAPVRAVGAQATVQDVAMQVIAMTTPGAEDAPVSGRALAERHIDGAFDDEAIEEMQSAVKAQIAVMGATLK